MEDYDINGHTEMTLNMLRAVLAERYNGGEPTAAVDVESECQAGNLLFRQRIRMEFDVSKSTP